MTSYQTCVVALLPRTAFGSIPKGDTLFGQICWSIRHRFGEGRLADLLAGYAENRPFLVVSDAFPEGHVLCPTLPARYSTLERVDPKDRKAAKKKIWLPMEKLHLPVTQWMEHSLPEEGVPSGPLNPYSQSHNTINRRTGTTGKGRFSPYSTSQLWFGTPRKALEPEGPSPRMNLYLVFDSERIALSEVRKVLEDVGLNGFGRDASIGLGKFNLVSLEIAELPSHSKPNAWLTLAPCAPQGGRWNGALCFYTPFTRFGRHGDIGVHYGNPFKNPVLLANTAAILTPVQMDDSRFVGQGMGGNGTISLSIPKTVHQGYAPVIKVVLADQSIREES